MNTQISFLEGEYTLIHIPLNLYTSLLQPILRILLPQAPSFSQENDLANTITNLTIANPNQHFLNISITPIEASIVCHTSLSTAHFIPLIASLPKDVASTVQVSQNDFVILSVISAGLDAAGRVMELTSPLALAGIPIFFISTYYSDFILVPSKERDNVGKALLARGFELSDSQQGQFVTARPRTSSRSTTPPPKSPPPSNLAELKTKAFNTLRTRNVTPKVLQDLELVQCSGKEISPVTDEVYSTRPSNGRHRSTWLDTIDTRLYTCIISALVSQPRFLSLTLAQDDPPSLLLDRNLLDLFGDTLVGDTEGRYIPIFLDLAHLPLEVTGIVCGVAGRLVEEMKMGEKSSELSYLSTARAGAVILPEGLSKAAVEVLEGLLRVDET